MEQQDDKIRYPEAAAITGLKVPTLQSMVSRKQVPHIRLGRRLVVFSKQDLMAWMSARKVSAK